MGMHPGMALAPVPVMMPNGQMAYMMQPQGAGGPPFRGGGGVGFPQQGYGGRGGGRGGGDRRGGRGGGYNQDARYKPY